MIGRCRRYQRQIALFVGGDLDERWAPGLRLHVRECRRCARVLQSAQASQAALSTAASADLPEVGALMLDSVRSWSRPAPQRAGWRGWVSPLSLAAACVVLGVFAAALPGPEGRPPTAPAYSEVSPWDLPAVAPRPASARKRLLREARPAEPRKRERF